MRIRDVLITVVGTKMSVNVKVCDEVQLFVCVS